MRIRPVFAVVGLVGVGIVILGAWWVYHFMQTEWGPFAAFPGLILIGIGGKIGQVGFRKANPEPPFDLEAAVIKELPEGSYDAWASSAIRRPEKASPKASGEAGPSEWAKLWNARVDALKVILGEPDNIVRHALVPFHLGGEADVLIFRNHVKGVAYVTSDLIGEKSQIRTDLGNYELMICHRDDNNWGPGMIARLARYTLDAKVNPWETMDLSPIAREDWKIRGLLFAPYKKFQVRGEPCGLLLCVGITADELEACKNGRKQYVVKRLKDHGVLPFTDLERESVLK
jgi:hypothetical protein